MSCNTLLGTTAPDASTRFGPIIEISRPLPPFETLLVGFEGDTSSWITCGSLNSSFLSFNTRLSELIPTLFLTSPLLMSLNSPGKFTS